MRFSCHLGFLAVMAGTIGTPSLGLADNNVAPTKAIIAKQFDVWNSALKSGDPQKVAALYCQPGGVLIPTLSNEIRSSRVEIADYFRHFLQLKPRGRLKVSLIRILSSSVAVNSGVYTFHLVKNGKPAEVKARFTFVYVRRRGHWCIMEQHSSAMPEAPAVSSH